MPNWIRRHFEIIVVVLVVCAAFFQAAALNQLVAARWITGVQSTSPRTMVASVARSYRVSSAEPILSRNVFDSVTGPLNPAAPLAKITAPVELSNPLGAAVCEGIRAVIVTESSDPIWSVAALQGEGESAPMLRRVGATVNDREIAYIGFNPEFGSPAVWLLNATSLCQAVLFQHPSMPVAPLKSDRDAHRSDEAPTTAGQLSPELAAKIQKLNDTDYALDRSLVDEVMNRQELLMSTVRVVPEMKNGQTLGVRLFGIRPDSLLIQLGLQNGDRLDQINGFPLTNPEQALQAYAQLRIADNLTLGITRRGKAVNLAYAFR